VLVITTLHLPTRTNPHRIDYLGAALLTAGITAIVLVTTWGGTQYAWGSATIIGLGTFGVLALAAFGWVEMRVPEPILPLQLFRNANFSAIAGVTFVSGFRDVRRPIILLFPSSRRLLWSIYTRHSGFQALIVQADPSI